MTFGERLQQLREQAGLSQSQLAKASGVPVWTLRGYEQGKREPLWAVLFKLADGLNVPVDAFRVAASEPPKLQTEAAPKPAPKRPRKTDAAPAHFEAKPKRGRRT
jgi:transcriptional regulator with XRE-family HTH domain